MSDRIAIAGPSAFRTSAHRPCRSLVAALWIAVPAQAQEAAPDEPPAMLQQAAGDPGDLRLSGSFRAQYEFLHNQFRPGLPRNDDLLALQTTLLAEYRIGSVRLGAEIMDSRAYFDQEGSSVGNRDVNALEPLQAYVALDLGKLMGAGTRTNATLGRFTMDLGSRRFVGRNNYRNAANGFAGVKIDVNAPDKGDLTLFYTLPLVRLPRDREGVLDNKVVPDRQSFDLTFWGAFASQPNAIGRATAELYLFGLTERDPPGLVTLRRHLFTPGFRLVAYPVPTKLDFEVEAAYQFGHSRIEALATEADVRVSAYMLHAEIGYQFNDHWHSRVSVFYDRASGDRPGGAYNRFDSLYGPRRGDWGPTGIFGPLGRANISAPGARFEIQPSARTDGFVAYHAAWLDSATDSFAFTQVRDASGRSGSFAGYLAEMRLRYWLLPSRLQLDAGLATLINGRFLKDAPNANGYGDALTGYLAVRAVF